MKNDKILLPKIFIEKLCKEACGKCIDFECVDCSFRYLKTRIGITIAINIPQAVDDEEEFKGWSDLK